MSACEGVKGCLHVKEIKRWERREGNQEVGAMKEIKMWERCEGDQEVEMMSRSPRGGSDVGRMAWPGGAV